MVAAWLDQAGEPWHMVDELRAGGASRVAGGLINPVIGVRYSRAWGADESLPEARAFYGEWERTHGVRVFHPMRIQRFFKSPEQREFWKAKRRLDMLKPYARREILREESFPEAAPHLGGVEIEGGGWLDFQSLVQSGQEAARERGAFRQVRLHESEVHFGGAEVRWNGEAYSALVDCRGFMNDSEWWEGLDWRPAKGEILTVEWQRVREVDVIRSRDVFMVPLGQDRFRVGATYSWNVDELSPTGEGREELMRGLGQLVRPAGSVGVVDHLAGVRPILRDKLPVLGKHPRLPGLWICNGMGSRGGTLAPRMARLLVSALLDKFALPDEVNVVRYFP